MDVLKFVMDWYSFIRTNIIRIVGRIWQRDNEKAEKQLNYIPMHFTDKVFSANIRLTEGNLIAERLSDQMLDKNFVFLSEIFTKHKCLAVSIIDINKSYVGNIIFGLLLKEPSDVCLQELYHDVDELIEKRNCWKLKRLSDMPSKGDILLFWFDGNRNVIMRKNNELERIIFQRVSGTFYPFFDLCGCVTKISAYMCDITSSQPPSFPTNLSVPVDNSRNDSEATPLVTVGNSEISTEEIQEDKIIPMPEKLVELNSDGDRKDDDINKVDEGICIHCKKNPINTIIYRCGHHCLCGGCADVLMAAANEAHCPVCNDVIKDIIVPYCV